LRKSLSPINLGSFKKINKKSGKGEFLMETSLQICTSLALHYNRTTKLTRLRKYPLKTE
jgi:hypothetical protein